MCDFSLAACKSRPAIVGEKIKTYAFGTGTTGFAPVDETKHVSEATAVCLLPGSEIAFENGTVAIFRQVNKEQPSMHHDGLEFPDGTFRLLGLLPNDILPIGSVATVLQLPAAPKTEKEADEQKRVEYAG